jgi:hypothetical protein
MQYAVHLPDQPLQPRVPTPACMPRKLKRKRRNMKWRQYGQQVLVINIQ